MQRLLAHLAEHPVTTLAALRDAGVTRNELEDAYLDGYILHPCHGVYASRTAEEEPAYQDAVMSLACGGLLFRRTMGMRLGLTTDLPHWTEWLIPYDATAPRHPPWSCRFIRSRVEASFTVGIQVEEVLGIPVRSTTPARTVVDHYRTWPPKVPGVPIQHVTESLHCYLSDRGSPDELVRVAKAFGPGLHRKIELALETIMGGPTF